MGAIIKDGIPYGGDSGNGGHAIINSGGSAMNERSNLKFAGYTKLSDDALNNTTVVSNDPTPITYADWQELTTQQKEGTYWLITGGPTGNFLAYGSDVIGGGGGGAAEGRILTFNTLISDSPIVINDTDITDLTDAQRLQKATTILSTRLPMEKAEQVFAEIEIAVKCNISEDNLQGNMRFEAFYVLNGEVDKEIRPHSIQHFTVQTENEWNIIRLFYLTPELSIGNNLLAVKLLCTGGTAEIGISAEDTDYGDALMVCKSEGLPIGQVIEDVRPVSITLTGQDEYAYLDTIHLADFTVTCQYSNGNTYDITSLVNFNPIMDTVVGNDDFTLRASYMGLTSDLPILVDKVDSLEVTGPSSIHTAHRLNLEDYTVKAVLQSGDKIDVTKECTFDPAMGTVLTEDTDMVVTYAPLWTETSPEMEIFSLEMATVVETLTGGAAPNDTITYTLYDDDYVRITGHPQEYGTYQAGYTYSTFELPSFTTMPRQYTLEFALNDMDNYQYRQKVSLNFPQLPGGKGIIKKIVNNTYYEYYGGMRQYKIEEIWNKINFKGQSLITSKDLCNILQVNSINAYSSKEQHALDLSYSFEYCTNLTNLNFFGYGDENHSLSLNGITGNCTLEGMFKDCWYLSDISYLGTINYYGGSGGAPEIDASSLFENCDELRNISTFGLGYFDNETGFINIQPGFTNVSNMFARSYSAYEADPTFADTHILDADNLKWSVPNTWTKATLGIKEGSGLSNQIGFLFGTDVPQSETSLANKDYPLPQWYATLCEYTE